MGVYLEISNVFTKPEAEEGELVIVYLTLKNKHTSDILACLTGCYDTEEMRTNWATLKAGTEYSWNIRFTMPNRSVTVWVWACYQTAVEPYYVVDDEYGPISISLPGVPPEYTGRIGTIHVNDYPVPRTLSYGDDFRIQFRGYLDSGERVRLWANIKVRSPTRTVYSHPGDLEIYPGTGVGGSHPFGFPTFVPYQSPIVVDEAGEWEVTIELRAGGATGPLLDVKRSIHLITVPEVVEPEYDGEIQNVQVRHGVHNWMQVPQTLVSGRLFSVAFEGVNRSDIALVLRGKINIGDVSDSIISTVFGVPFLEDAIAPDGVYTFKFTPWSQPHPYMTDVSGDYIAKLELEGKKPGEDDSQFKPLCDPQEVVVIVVTGEAGFEGKISSVRVDWTMIPGGEVTIPTVGILGREARIRFNGSNDDTFPHTLCGKVWVYGPSEEPYANLKHFFEGCSLVYILGGFSHAFCFPPVVGEPGFIVNEEGEWNVKIRLEDSGGGVLDEYEGVLFTRTEKEPESMWGMLSSIIPLVMIVMMMSMIMPMTRELGEGE